jgi:hypothetical protein
MRRIILLLGITVISHVSFSQLLVGADVGTFNFFQAKVRGFAPTVKIEKFVSDGVGALYLEASLYNKAGGIGEATITDDDGAYIGDAEENTRYSVKHLQLGFKSFLGKPADVRSLTFFLGGGASVLFEQTKNSYKLDGYTIPDSKFNQKMFAFHFHLGVQYNFDPVIIELKGTCDLAMKPMISASSYFVSSTRLGVLIPITK